MALRDVGAVKNDPALPQSAGTAAIMSTVLSIPRMKLRNLFDHIPLLFGAVLVGGMLAMKFVSDPSWETTQETLPILIALALGYALAVSVSRFSLRTWLNALEGIAPFLPIIAFMATLVAIGDRAGTASFYSTSAEVIPVFLLALALEARVFTIRGFQSNAELLLAIVTLGFLGSGEYYALKALASNPHATDVDIVAGAVAAGFVGVATIALTARPATHADQVVDEAEGKHEREN